MKDICQVFMIDKTRTSPYHPQGNGQVERFNRVIADNISNNCAEKPQEWDLYLPHVNFVYNATVHKTLGTTPFPMLYRREARYSIDLFYPKTPGDPRLNLGEVGESLPKPSERLTRKTLPSNEEIEDESNSSDQETENRPYHVFRPTSEEIQANRNPPDV